MRLIFCDAGVCVFNSVTPEGDQRLISPYGIAAKSSITVKRMKGMIPNLRCSRLLNKFLPVFCCGIKNVWTTAYLSIFLDQFMRNRRLRLLHWECV